MCIEKDCPSEADRRSFLAGGAAALAGLIASSGEAEGQEKDKDKEKKSKEARAVDDPKIVLERVEFKSDKDVVDGYLARPKGKESLRTVVVIPGSWAVEPYIPETVAMLAQAGYAGLAVNVLHFFPKVKSYEEAEKVPFEKTQELIRKEYSDERTIRDVQSGIEYIKSQSFAKGEPVALMGFCGGGSQALLCAAELKGIAAVVPFYAPVALKLPKRKTPMDVVKAIKVPVQGHYGKNDKGIPLDEVKKFEEALRGQETPVEIFTYDAGHGFFAYNRDEAYQAEAAKQAWDRALKFFAKHLKS